MKKFFILTALLALFSLTSCEKAPLKAIVGTWEAETLEISYEGMNLSFELEEMGAAFIATFNKNGTGSFITEEEGYVESENFTYTVTDDTLYLTEYDETTAIPYEINGKTLTLFLVDYDDEGIAKLHLVKK